MLEVLVTGALGPLLSTAAGLVMLSLVDGVDPLPFAAAGLAKLVPVGGVVDVVLENRGLGLAKKLKALKDALSAFALASLVDYKGLDPSISNSNLAPCTQL